MLMFKSVLALVGAMAIGTAASAVTLVSSTNGPDTGPAAGQYIITNFDNADHLSGGYKLVKGSAASYAAPYKDTTQYLAVLAGKTASLAISPAVKTLSFYWGSIDDYNTVSFYNGSTLVGSFTGDQIPLAPADGTQGSPLNNRRVNWSFDGAVVTRVDFTSSRNAFEVDSVAGAVPEPATWAMLVLGMALVGTSMRARSRKPMSVTA
jgi:hypothetical protein